MKLTKSIVDRAAYGGASYSGKPSRYVLWDDDLRGFGVRIFPSGVKTFVLSYRSGGRKRLMKIGRYGVLTVDQARKKARKLLSRVDEGADPLAELQEKRLKASQAKTVSELCDIFIERHAKVRKKSWKEDQRKIDKLIKPELGHLRIEDVTRERIARLYRKIGADRPYVANRLLNLLSTMFNMATEWGLVSETSANPAAMKRHSMFREKRRDRPVKTEELPRLLDAIEAESSPYVRGVLKLLLLTGLRKNEVLRAKWINIDLGRGTLRLEDTKAGRPRHVPLSSAALEIIRALPKMVGNAEFLFPSPTKVGAPLYDLKKPWERVRKAAECPDLRIHDLRHTVATLLAESGHPAQTIQQALGHHNIQQTMGYVHAGDQHAREALEELGRQILEVRK